MRSKKGEKRHNTLTRVRWGAAIRVRIIKKIRESLHGFNSKRGAPKQKVCMSREGATAKANELAEEFRADRRVCSCGVSILLFSGLSYVRNTSYEDACNAIEMAYHAGQDLGDWTLDEYQRAFQFAKELASLPLYDVISFIVEMRSVGEMCQALGVAPVALDGESAIR